MYKIVEAVNQQIPFTVNPGQMLILTKFAEMLPQSPKTAQGFRLRIGRERFMAMTHMKKDAIKDNLIKLDQLGFLRCLENRSEKRIGDRPTLYELRLPEGYDEDSVQKHWHRCYGGREFNPLYNECNREFYESAEENSRTMTPFSVEEAEKSAEQEEKSAEQEEKSAVYVGKNRPTNNRRTKEHNNNKSVLSVVDVSDEVEAVRAEAAKLTKVPAVKFKDCGLTVDNIPLMHEAMEIYRKHDRSGIPTNQNAAYLIGIFRNIVAKKPAGPIQPNPNDPTPENIARKATEDGWQRLVDGFGLTDIGTEELNQIKAKYVKMVNSYPSDKRADAVKKLLSDLQFVDGKPVSFSDLRASRSLADNVKAMMDKFTIMARD